MHELQATVYVCLRLICTHLCIYASTCIRTEWTQLRGKPKRKLILAWRWFSFRFFIFSKLSKGSGLLQRLSSAMYSSAVCNSLAGETWRNRCQSNTAGTATPCAFVCVCVCFLRVSLFDYQGMCKMNSHSVSSARPLLSVCTVNSVFKLCSLP